MGMPSHSLPHSDGMLRSEGCTKCEDNLPVTTLEPQPLHSSIDNVSNDDPLHVNLNDDNTLPSEDSLDDDLTTNDVLGVVEVLDPVENMKRSFSRDIVEISHEPNYNYEEIFNVEFDPFTESSRDCRHVGDLGWHEYYHMRNLEETALTSMRYTLCDPSIDRCFHRPSPVLEVFEIKLQTTLLDVTAPVEVYGIVAVRDSEDYRRNYLFNRSRDNPLAINPNCDYLCLMGPKRAISLKYNILIEVDIRVKMIGNNEDDITLIDGCMRFMEDDVSFCTPYKCISNGPYGVTTLNMIMFQLGVEATIQLEFLKVPRDGFELRMYGYTSVLKNVYTFIDKTRECQSFISSTGRHSQHFVAAVHINDVLNIDFMEGGHSIPFKAAIHGSEKKLHHFLNGAIVAVMVYWSTAYYCC